jgi:RNA-directed DNA polymerase
MRRESHVRFREGAGVKLPRATRLVILVDAHPRHAWLLTAVTKRLREELASLQVEVNEEKSRLVDLTKGETFGFLGFTIRRLRSKRGGWWPQRTPQL